MEFMSPEWISGLIAIIIANILLSGDNAVVIALAARSLPPHQQKMAILGGSAAAIVMRIVLTIVAVQLLTLPYLKLIGGILLVYIGVTLMMDDGGEEGHEVGSGLWAAVRTILIADLVMSLDNVLAVAAAAKGSMSLLIIGLGISIPLIIFGSTMLLKIMERFPIIITIGAALLGFLAGEMILTDPAVVGWVGETSGTSHKMAGAIGAAAVVILGMAMQRRARARADAAGVGSAVRSH